MSNRSYGLAYERKEKHLWQDNGSFAHRARGSFGLFDLIVSDLTEWKLISVKSTKQKYFSFKREIKKIKSFDKAPAGTRVMLILYHKGKRKILFEKRLGDTDVI